MPDTTTDRSQRIAQLERQVNDLLGPLVADESEHGVEVEKAAAICEGIEYALHRCPAPENGPHHPVRQEFRQVASTCYGVAGHYRRRHAELVEQARDHYGLKWAEVLPLCAELHFLRKNKAGEGDA